MSLLVPDSGLLFWMLLSFIIVFVVVGKFGFPYIVKAVEKRRENITQSLQGAKEADLKISKVKEESDSIVAAANREQGRVLRDASDQRGKIIAEAKNEAVQAAQKEINAAKEQIRLQKEEAIRDIRREVASLSCDIAEKILRQQLSDKDKQMAMVDRMITEVLDKEKSEVRN